MVENEGNAIVDVFPADVVVYPTVVKDIINVAIVSNEIENYTVEVTTAEGQTMTKVQTGSVNKALLQIPAGNYKQGRVIFYADSMTDSMQKAINETKRRRDIQEAYNKENNITPKTIIKEIRESVHGKESKEETRRYLKKKIHTQKEKDKIIKAYETEMREAAKNLDFERAAELRDLIIEIRAKD